MANQACTITEERYSTIKKITFDWLSDDAAGTFVATPTVGTTTYAYTGEIIRVVTNPDGGATQPSDNYTVTVLDADGNDVLMGACTGNRDTANTEQVLASSLGCVANDKLALGISGAGNAKGGVVYLYIR